MTGVLCDTNRSRSAIEVTTLGDGAVRVDATGLFDAYERAARRWSRTRLVAAILSTLALSGSLGLGAMALRWDVQHRRDVQVLKFVLQETETRAMCWRAMASRWNPTREDIVTVDGHDAWVRRCVEGELRRQQGGAVRSAREGALVKPEKANHDRAIRRASEP